jgi:hypothetical protein
MFSHASRSDYSHLFAQYNTLMVKFGKAFYTVLVVRHGSNALSFEFIFCFGCGQHICHYFFIVC